MSRPTLIKFRFRKMADQTVKFCKIVSLFRFMNQVAANSEEREPGLTAVLGRINAALDTSLEPIMAKLMSDYQDGLSYVRKALAKDMRKDSNALNQLSLQSKNAKDYDLTELLKIGQYYLAGNDDETPLKNAIVQIERFKACEAVLIMFDALGHTALVNIYDEKVDSIPAPPAASREENIANKTKAAGNRKKAGRRR